MESVWQTGKNLTNQHGKSCHGLQSIFTLLREDASTRESWCSQTLSRAKVGLPPLVFHVTALSVRFPPLASSRDAEAVGRRSSPADGAFLWN